MLEELSDGDGLRISGELTGLSFGKHGIHVHEIGVTGNNCNDAGGHCTSVSITTLFPLNFLTNIDNPTGQYHGAPEDLERHVGDWGNLDVSSNPYVLSFTDHVAKLHGDHSIVGVSMSLEALQSVISWLMRE
jgi:Cu-Zn family superoxide dismutase